MAGTRLTQLEPHGVPGRRYGAFANKAVTVPVVPVITPAPDTDDHSRDYERKLQRAGDWRRSLPDDRFGWSRPGGGTPARR